MRCELCRRQNAEGAEHCIFCGKELARPQGQAGSQAPSADPGRNRIANDSGQTAPDLENMDVTIGPPGPDGACELRIAIRIPLPSLPIPETPATPASTPDSDRGPHGVVLCRISSDPKRWAAARVIALLRDIPLSDAVQLTTRTIIPVLKGVTLDEAEKALELFQALRISGRITTKRAV